MKDAGNDAAGMSRVYANITASIATELIPAGVSANIYTQTSDVETEADGPKTSSISRFRCHRRRKTRIFAKTGSGQNIWRT